MLTTHAIIKQSTHFSVCWLHLVDFFLFFLHLLNHHFGNVVAPTDGFHSIKINTLCLDAFL